MPTRIRALVLSGNGTNCERETARACTLAGADSVEIVSIWSLLDGDGDLAECDLLCLPGGFTDGDDLGAAQAAAVRIRYARVRRTGRPLVESLQALVARGGLVIGICNGFQLLVKLGLLPCGLFAPSVTLTVNRSGRFEARWVALTADPASPCIFTRGLDVLELPVRHGEGRLVVGSPEVGADLRARHLVPLRYANPATSEATAEYPANPNGSWDNAAGLCDPTGRIFGLMPHPEAFLTRTNHPRWTREPLPDEGLGVALFRNAVDHLRLWI